MKSIYLYILECNDGLLYTGITNDLTRRINEHNDGRNKNAFTQSRRPVKLIFEQQFLDINQGIYFEKKIKRWSAKKKRALASSDFDTLQLLAECRNFTHYKFRPTQKEIEERLKEFY